MMMRCAVPSRHAAESIRGFNLFKEPIFQVNTLPPPAYKVHIKLHGSMLLVPNYDPCRMMQKETRFRLPKQLFPPHFPVQFDASLLTGDMLL